MLNSNKIKGRLRELGLTQNDVSKVLKIAQSTVAQKINGVRPMTIDEAAKLAILLSLSPTQYEEYFFNNKIA